MAKFYRYKARDRNGQLLSGEIIAETEAGVAAYIRDKGYFVTQIKAKSHLGSIQSWLYVLQPVTTRDLAGFCRQFAAMVDAGLTLLVCLNVLIEQTHNAKLKAALRTVFKKVQEGEMLSQAMCRHARIFPEVMISMIAAGEKGGVLDKILNRLAIHYEKEHKLKERVTTATIYPGFVVALALLCGTFILIYILPVFAKMFTDMQLELPLITRIILGAGNFIIEVGVWLAVGLFLTGTCVMLATHHLKYRIILDRVLLWLPVSGQLLRKLAIARFSRTLATLVRGGVPLIAALEVVKKTVGNLIIVQAIDSAQSSVRQGSGIASTLGASTVFPPMAVQMIAIGEETGNLDKMLEKVADFYESDVDDLVSRLSSILEPVLISIVGVMVGFIVVSIVLPMFDIVTRIPQ
ncbi:type II secretion system F family protein [Sporomusa aerivorans]|uniref:type II secretion system F family protein n=1 Tax=Sporomusa aerivorans TaxID=204936 RepID=UPI00352A4339